MKIDKNVETSNQAPGKILPTGQIELHSLIAHRLFHGESDPSKRKKTPCFLQYAAQLNVLWDCSLKDDPWADAKLLDIEASMEKIDKVLSDCDVELDKGFEKLAQIGLTTQIGSSRQPVLIDLSFRTVHAAATAQLLARLDRVIRKALALKHFGQLDQSAWQGTRSQTVSPMRSLFAQSRFTHFGFTRKKLATISEEDKKEIEAKLGVLPKPILAGNLRPELGPRK